MKIPRVEANATVGPIASVAAHVHPGTNAHAIPATVATTAPESRT